MQTPPVNDLAPRALRGRPGPDTGPGDHAAEPAGTGEVLTRDTTIGTLGDEPMGGLPHTAPAGVPGQIRPSSAAGLLPRALDGQPRRRSSSPG